MKGKNDFIPALLKEMERRREYLAGETVATVYFGGGTPSLLETDELDRIMRRLRAIFPLAPDAEITLEANPDDINTPARLAAWRSAGINRLSIGVQSFFEEDLRWMNRAHDARQALDCLGMAQREGFDNLSIDLIYGGPTLPDSHWRQNVDRAIDLGVQHLSCYALTVEPRTALDTLVRRHQSQGVDPDDQARQFHLLMDWMAGAGYEHYEISNFAIPGHRSRHNASYWQGKPYLGLGPSAHSFDGVSRQWNVANNAQYVAAIDDGQESFVAEKEVLTPVQQLNEYIMISLRTIEGSSLSLIGRRFGAELAKALKEKAYLYIQKGQIRPGSEMLQLTSEGKLFADGIAAGLFF